MIADAAHKFRRFECLLPTILAAGVATGVEPLVTIAGLLLLCYVPGRLIVVGCQLAREWDAAGRALLSIVMSLAVTPLLINPIWHDTNQRWPLLGFCWLLFTVGYWLAEWARRDFSFRATEATANIDVSSAPTAKLRLVDQTRTKVVLAIVAALVAVVTIGTYWPTELRGYPVPCLIHDFIKHHGVLFSMEQRPLPLGNPFYANEAAGPVYYYHFFYLIPATLRAFSANMSIELAFGLQSALIGLGFAGIIYLIVKRFTGSDAPATLALLLATVVGGLDVIPLAIMRTPVVTLDAWADFSTFRIHSLLTQIVWTGQNMQGLLVAVLGVYCLSEKRWWGGWIFLGPVLVASMVGASIWFAVALAPALTVLVLMEIYAQRYSLQAALSRLLAAAIAAALMLALSLPNLAGYAEMSRRQHVGLTTHWPHAGTALLGKLAPPGVFANLLDYPWVLAIEFGPLILFPILMPRRIWRRAWQDPGLRLLLITSALALIAFIVVRSDFIYNAFGQRIIMAPMAAGAILGGCILASETGRKRILNPLGWTLPGQTAERPRKLLAWFVGLTIIAGLPVALFQSPLAAVRRYFTENSALHMFASKLGQQAADDAAVDRFLRYELPPGAVLQPFSGTERLYIAQIARRQLGVTIIEPDTVIFHPKDTETFEQTLRDVTAALRTPVPSQDLHRILRASGVTYVLVGAIERENWTDLERFDDGSFFERVFADETAAVYALR